MTISTDTKNGTERAATKKPLTKRSLALSLRAAGRSVEEIARALECSVESAAACIVPPNRCAKVGCNKFVRKEGAMCEDCATIDRLWNRFLKESMRAVRLAGWLSLSLLGNAIGWGLFLWKVLAR